MTPCLEVGRKSTLDLFVAVNLKKETRKKIRVVRGTRKRDIHHTPRNRFFKNVRNVKTQQHTMPSMQMELRIKTASMPFQKARMPSVR